MLFSLFSGYLLKIPDSRGLYFRLQNASLQGGSATFSIVGFQKLSVMFTREKLTGSNFRAGP